MSFSQREVKEEIKILTSKNAPGFDLITDEILKQLSKQGLLMITFIFNSIIKLKYVLRSCKIAEIIMIPKPGKPLIEVKSYRPISFLSIILKVFEKLLIKRIKVIIEERELIPNYQFGFRPKHSTVYPIHRTTKMSKRKHLKKEKYTRKYFWTLPRRLIRLGTTDYYIN